VFFLARTVFNAAFCENTIQRTDLGETALKQVQTDEGSEEQKVFAHEYWAGFDSQRQSQQNERACDDTDYAFCIH
jgi:hypothetical protein